MTIGTAVRGKNSAINWRCAEYSTLILSARTGTVCTVSYITPLRWLFGNRSMHLRVGLTAKFRPCFSLLSYGSLAKPSLPAQLFSRAWTTHFQRKLTLLRAHGISKPYRFLNLLAPTLSSRRGAESAENCGAIGITLTASVRFSYSEFEATFYEGTFML